MPDRPRRLFKRVRSRLVGIMLVLFTGLIGPAAMSLRIPFIAASGRDMLWASILTFAIVAGLLWHAVGRAPFRILIAPLAGGVCGVVGIGLVWGTWIAHAALDGPPVHDPDDPWKLSHWEAFYFIGFLAALDVVPVLAAIWGVSALAAWLRLPRRKSHQEIDGEPPSASSSASND